MIELCEQRAHLVRAAGYEDAVEEAWRGHGIGAALMQRAVTAAGRLRHQAVLLVGDAPYSERFGFSAEKTGGLWLPGPYERPRLLGCELIPGAIAGAPARRVTASNLPTNEMCPIGNGQSSEPK